MTLDITSNDLDIMLWKKRVAKSIEGLEKVKILLTTDKPNLKFDIIVRRVYETTKEHHKKESEVSFRFWFAKEIKSYIEWIKWLENNNVTSQYEKKNEEMNNFTMLYQEILFYIRNQEATNNKTDTSSVIEQTHQKTKKILPFK